MIRPPDRSPALTWESTRWPSRPAKVGTMRERDGNFFERTGTMCSLISRPGARERDDTLPTLIPIGRRTGEVRNLDTSPGSVRSANDLPERFLTGTLDPSSFSLTGKVWRARYVDAAPGSWTTVELNERGQLRVETWWQGVQGAISYCGFPPTWARAVQTTFLHEIPGDWANLQRERLQSTYCPLRHFCANAF
jgi:hypothetical protein